MQRAHKGGGHSWHSWKTLLAQLEKAAGTAGTCVQCMLPAHMAFTLRARFAHPEHNLTHTRALEFLEYREARECPVPGVLMSHPTPDVTWVPCTWSLPRNPLKCGSMGTLCTVPVNTTLVGPGGGRTCLPLLPPGLEDPSTQQGQSLLWGDAVEQSGHRQGWGYPEWSPNSPWSPSTPHCSLGSARGRQQLPVPQGLARGNFSA